MLYGMNARIVRTGIAGWSNTGVSSLTSDASGSNDAETWSALTPFHVSVVATTRRARRRTGLMDPSLSSITVGSSWNGTR